MAACATVALHFISSDTGATLATIEIALANEVEYAYKWVRIGDDASLLCGKNFCLGVSAFLSHAVILSTTQTTNHLVIIRGWF